MHSRYYSEIADGPRPVRRKTADLVFAKKKELSMTASAAELAQELDALQKEFRAYSQTADFSFAEINAPKPNGFVENYRRRTAEIQNALSRMRLPRS